MFRYIIGMSRDKQFVIERSKAFADSIEHNLLKCAIYQNSTNDYNHWIGRISSWLYSISKAKHSGNKKLKPEDYRYNTFSFVGDSIEDAESDVIGFLATNEDNIERGSKSYPPVAYEKEMSSRLFNSWTSVVDVFPKMLAQTSTYSTTEIVKLLHDKLDPILLS